MKARKIAEGVRARRLRGKLAVTLRAISKLPFDLLCLSSGSVSLVDCVLFGHVFALFRRAVKTRAFPVVKMRLRVDPHKAVASARCGGVRRCFGRGARCGCWACGRCTGWRGSFRFE